MKKTLREIAELVNGTLIGDGDIEITGVTNIEDATGEDISFAVAPHLEKAALSSAAALIIPDTVTEFAKPAIRVENPRMAFVSLLKIFTPQITVASGVHSAAVIGNNVTLGENVSIMAYAVIADDVKIGDNTVVYPHTYIGHAAKLAREINV